MELCSAWRTRNKKTEKGQCNGSRLVHTTRVGSTHHLTQESVLNWLHVLSYQAHLKTVGRAVGGFRGEDAECDSWVEQGASWHTRQWAKQNVVEATQQKNDRTDRLTGRGDTFYLKKKKKNGIFFQSYLSSGFTALVRGLWHVQHIWSEYLDVGCENQVRPGRWIFSARTPSCDTCCSAGLSSGCRFWKEGRKETRTQGEGESRN